MTGNLASYFELNMRILGLCKPKPLSKTGVCKALTGHDVDVDGRVARRLSDLVARGLLVCQQMGLQRLNGTYRNTRKYYIITDEGVQALFFYKESLRFYGKSLEDPV